ncbi:MAG: hypothetical protein ACI4S4_00550, partial [Candidatus Ornithospirochaeta sp.]
FRNTDERIEDPFFVSLSSYYGFSDPWDFFRFGECLMDYVPYGDEVERIDFTLEEIYTMYEEGNMVFPGTDTPIEEVVRKEMKNMPKVLKRKTSGFTFSEALEIQNWMWDRNSLLRFFIPQVREAMDEHGLAVSFDSLPSRIMARYVKEKLRP